ncbi:MAG: hypothetical protein ABR549_02740 [Mycobacteriales bacterium]
MPARLIFRYQVCGAQPGEETRRSLEGQLLDLEWGQFTDAPPDQWLLWAGKGPYGQTRYACARHRITLRDFVRKHYGTLAGTPTPACWETSHLRYAASWRAAPPPSEREHRTSAA